MCYNTGELHFIFFHWIANMYIFILNTASFPHLFVTHSVLNIKLHKHTSFLHPTMEEICIYPQIISLPFTLLNILHTSFTIVVDLRYSKIPGRSTTICFLNSIITAKAFTSLLYIQVHILFQKIDF